MAWLFLIIGGLFEIGFASCLGKATQTKAPESLYWYAGFVVSVSISMFLLSKAMQSIPVGTAYAVWTGIGAVGTVLIGIFFFKEPVYFWRIFFIITLIASIVGLKFVSH